MSSKVSTTTNPSSDKPIEQKKSGGFEFDLMDFSELFPFGASLLNSIYVGVSNIEIVLTSDKYFFGKIMINIDIPLILLLL